MLAALGEVAEILAFNDAAVIDHVWTYLDESN